jgi:hypothetical protein
LKGGAQGDTPHRGERRPDVGPKRAGSAHPGWKNGPALAVAIGAGATPGPSPSPLLRALIRRTIGAASFFSAAIFAAPSGAIIDNEFDTAFSGELVPHSQGRFLCRIVPEFPTGLLSHDPVVMLAR